MNKAIEILEKELMYLEHQIDIKNYFNDSEIEQFKIQFKEVEKALDHLMLLNNLAV